MAAVPERRGRPSDKSATNAADKSAPNGANLSGRTDDYVARLVGFGSANTYRRARTVVEHGTPELVAAMDSGDVSINAAIVAGHREKHVEGALIPNIVFSTALPSAA